MPSCTAPHDSATLIALGLWSYERARTPFREPASSMTDPRVAGVVALLDWRRRVAGLYAEIRSTADEQGHDRADVGEQDGLLVLDFNFASQSSCSYDPSWSCPLAPPANRLAVPVRAGERLERPVNPVHCSTSASRSGMSIRGVRRSSCARSRTAAGDSPSASGGDSCRRPATRRTPSPASIAACRPLSACCWSACS